jgi:hypothetical protein
MDEGLSKISFALEYQRKELLYFGKKTVELLKESTQDENEIPQGSFKEIYRNIWFWTIAAYELTRTLDQKKKLFSEASGKRINSLKKSLNQLRIPFAKHEIAGTKQNTCSEMLISDIDFKKSDFHFEIKGEKVSFVELYKEFDELFTTMTAEDFKV